MCPLFLSNSYFYSEMITLRKLWKMLFFHQKISFRCRDIQFFVFSSFPLFLPVGRCFRGCSKVNFKVYDPINCLRKNSITHFVWYLKREKNMTLKLCPQMKYQIKNIFMEKSCRKCIAKASPRPLYNFGK